MKARRRGGLGALGMLLTAGAAGQPSPQLVLAQQVEVVGSTPLAGSELPLRQLPANVQLLGGAALARQPGATLSEVLEQQAAGVTVNAAQGNRYQPDLNFRGFSASPVLGTPQGISVFLDGMRLNEAFGDTVNWDLIPASAISHLQLLPGAMPAFGLNTLGGALALSSQRGDQAYPDQPGGQVSLSGGSFGRRALALEAGGHQGPWDWFATTDQAWDAGWMAHNRSRVRQFFGRLGWRQAGTEWDLSLGAANNHLEGAQTSPQSFGPTPQPYTYPDLNTNVGQWAQLRWHQPLSGGGVFSGQAWGRRLHNRNLSSNVNDDFGPDDDVQAHNDAASVQQTGGGLDAQWVYGGPGPGGAHQTSWGLSLDQGRARFRQATQDAMFTPDRSTQGQGGFRPHTDADASSRHLGAYVADSLVFAPRWTLSLSARCNQADVQIADRSGAAPELNGDHRFRRINPALGISFQAAPDWTLYAGYHEGMRAPTAMELTCADPEAPCKLPNNFLADPPLQAVVAKGWELGTRGQPDARTRLSAAWFRTDLHHDLQFVSSGGLATQAGYFQNVGLTRRQGLELSVDRQTGPWALNLRYTWLDATYRSGFQAHSPSHSQADAAGAIEVRPGDHLPSLPRHSLGARLAWSPTVPWTLAATLQLASAQTARGDDNGQDVHGPLPGHGLLNLDLRWTRDPQFSVFARVDNAFNRRYASFALLGQNVFTGPGNSFDGAQPRAEQFRGYGAPRAFTLGLDYRFE